ncbi:hypothetical protein MPSEU_000972300 [Mayamaea pseudoterrestris]|nr:hypothetical protein MPSEU_000972300 [Mayamaea pseudoterrestris]
MSSSSSSSSQSSIASSSASKKRKQLEMLESETEMEHSDTSFPSEEAAAAAAAGAAARPTKRSKLEAKQEGFLKAQKWSEDQTKQAKEALLTPPRKTALFDAKHVVVTSTTATSPAAASLSSDSSLTSSSKPAASFVPPPPSRNHQIKASPRAFQGLSPLASTSPTLKTTFHVAAPMHVRSTASTNMGFGSAIERQGNIIASPPRYPSPVAPCRNVHASRQHATDGYETGDSNPTVHAARIASKALNFNKSNIEIIDSVYKQPAVYNQRDERGYETGDSNENEYAARGHTDEQQHAGYHDSGLESDEEEEHDDKGDFYQLRESPNDSDYETADEELEDSDNEEDAQDKEEFEIEPHAPCFFWRNMFLGVLNVFDFLVKCVTALVLLAFVMECLSVNELNRSTPVLLDKAPCFASNTMEDASAPWSQRCVAASIAHQLLPCPRGGICGSGKLLSCEFEGVDAFSSSEDGSTCQLNPVAAATYDAIIEHLKNLSLTSLRHGPSSTTVRSQGWLTTESLSNETPHIMFNFYDIVKELELTNVDGNDQDSSVIIDWFDAALKHRVVDGFNLEWNSDGVWIGFPQDTLQEMTRLTSQQVAMEWMHDVVFRVWNEWGVLLVDALQEFWKTSVNEFWRACRWSNLCQ